MHITFIQPSVGRKPDGAPYPASWCMEPLSIATLSALTPARHRRIFVDDRLEAIPFDRPTDLACLSVETYTARRSYQIAAEYRQRGVPVVLGGFHTTLVPDEAAQHADAIVIGEAEPIWTNLLDDAAAGTLKPRYQASARPDLAGLVYDRAIYAGLPYGRLALVETSRGCHFDCEFCSIAGFFRQSFRPRPIADIVAELRTLPQKYLFFVDDNIGADPERLRELCEALIPLKRRWIGQLSLHVAQDDALLRLLRRSGCEGVLIGFESLNPQILAAMGKSVNAGGTDYDAALGRLRRHGLSVYATFVFGYDGDTRETFEETYRFALRQKFFFCAFNHLVPFPGTKLFARFQAEGRLLHDAWWLDENYRFGDIAFRPAAMAPEELSALCLEYRRRFYSLGSTLRRGLDFRANCRTPLKAAIYLAQSLTGRREVDRRQGLPLGFPEAGR
jgi:radical SAM superfamily enzyme YgiQ (UPF0313 family)